MNKDYKFKLGDVITCLSEDKFVSKLGRSFFRYKGDFHKYTGKKCKILDIYDGKILIRWLDAGEEYNMDPAEFEEFYVRDPKSFSICYENQLGEMVKEKVEAYDINDVLEKKQESIKKLYYHMVE